MSPVRQTHTYAILKVTEETFREIRDKLIQAGYQHLFHTESDGPVIDMQGIALQQVIDLQEEKS